MSGARVAAAALERVTTEILAAAGCPTDEARVVAAHLVLANLVGHDSHGVIRLRDYVPWIERGMGVPAAALRVVHETPVALAVDGGLGFGQAVGEVAIRLAIAKAEAAGLAALAIRNTGHLGRIGHWAERCAEAGLASLHVVNTSGFGVLVAPFGSREARLASARQLASLGAWRGCPRTRSRSACRTPAAHRSSWTSPRRASPRARSRWR